MYFDRLLDFVYVEFMKGLQRGFIPKRCANCGCWFLQTPGATFAYCAGPAPEYPGKTCREIGAASSFKDKVANNEVWQVQQRAYKKYYARTMRKGKAKAVSVIPVDMKSVPPHLPKVSANGSKEKQVPILF